MKRRQLKAMPEGPAKAMHERYERRKAQVRAIVEHPFHVIKNLFRYRKVSYRGIAKNEARAKAHAALANLYIARWRLLSQGSVDLQAQKLGPYRPEDRCSARPSNAALSSRRPPSVVLRISPVIDQRFCSRESRLRTRHNGPEFRFRGVL